MYSIISEAMEGEVILNEITTHTIIQLMYREQQLLQVMLYCYLSIVMDCSFIYCVAITRSPSENSVCVFIHEIIK